MGEVYQAYDERLERRVALKQIRPEAAHSPRARQRFLREARTAAQLNHPALVAIYDIVEAVGCHWIVMELAEGETLASRLVERGPLDPSQALDLALELTTGLAAAHGAGIVHRDLKTENVVVTASGQVKILDFGLAKPLADVRRETDPSALGQLVGTPRAMSPEQALGQDVDHRSDLFSLGTLLYEAVTGTSPFLSPDGTKTLDRVRGHEQRPACELVPEVPQGFSDLVDRLLEKEVSRRPQTAEGVVVLLKRVQESPQTEIHQADVVATDATRLRGAPHAVGERRQVTVLVGSLVNLDTEGSPLGPETLAHVWSEFQAQTAEMIRRFSGHLGHRLGHHVVVYFGYPRASEDDPRRAAAMALELVARVDDLNALLQAEEAPQRLAVQVGIHTGPAVVLPGEAGKEQLVLGETLDLALAMGRLATANQVVVTPNTFRLVHSFFRHKLQATASLPGFPQPVAVQQILAPLETSKRFEDETSTPLVARSQELDLLLRRWRAAVEGTGQVMLLSGEAGIGKSRLVHTLKERLRPESPSWRMAQGVAYAQNSPFYPMIELLRRLLHLDPDQPPTQQLSGMEEALSRYGLALPDTVPLLAQLFSVPLEGRYHALGLSPQARRARTQQAAVSLLLRMSQERPMVLLVEDLHWMDPSSLEFLGLLIDQVEAGPLLLLLTFRPHFEPPWSHGHNLTQLSLSRLSGHDVELLIRRVTGGKALPQELLTEIVSKTDGVPLFVEELTKSLLESGVVVEEEERYVLAQDSASLGIPATLRDSLTARLDRLGTAKEVAQLAAVVGRESSYALLKAVCPQDPATLDRALERLVRAELLYRRGFASRTRYLFKHALIQDAAYDSLIKEQRQEHHQTIAHVLEDEFQKTVQTQPELLAHHYTEADLQEPALVYWQQAADRGLERSASQEAIAHAKRGLELIEARSDTPRWDQKELDLRVALGAGLINARGLAAPEVEVAFARARELCERIGPAPQRLRVLLRLIEYHGARAAFHQGLELAEFMFRLPEAHERLEAYNLMGALNWSLGRAAVAQEHLAKGHQLLSQQRVVVTADVGDLHPKAKLLLYRGLVQWQLGYGDQAWTYVQEAVALARQADPFSVAYSLAHAGWLYFFLREYDALRVSREELITLSEEKGYFFVGSANILLGWARIVGRSQGHAAHAAGAADADAADAADRQEELDPWIERMHGGLNHFQGTGARICGTLFLSALAEACASLGRWKEARAYLEEALAAVKETGERFWEPELHRQKGELELALHPGAVDGESRAEVCFKQALHLARGQEARFLELRSALSLSRLWSAQSKDQEARELLGPVYRWFREGLDTADLKEARAFLESVS